MPTQPTPIPRTVRVFLAVRHASLRNALWRLLETEPHVEPLAAIADLDDLTQLLARVTPPVVVVDEAILGVDGIRELPDLVAGAPATAFVVVGQGDHPAYVTRAREAGAADYVPVDEAERLGSVIEASSRSAGGSQFRSRGATDDVRRDAARGALGRRARARWA